jgi:hypothetical protein
MRRMRPVVELLSDQAPNYYVISHIYTGLDRLARRGAIRLVVRRSRRDEADLLRYDGGLWLKVHPEGGPRPVLLAIDLHDRSESYALKTLARCDVYFKRSFRRASIPDVPAEVAARIRPYGLHFPCRSPGSVRRLLRSAGPRLLRQGRPGVHQIYSALVHPWASEFEQGPESAVEPTVFFQTRVWEEENAPGEAESINASRVALVRALREAFGDRFRGGVLPTPLARERYPDDLTPLPCRARAYVATARRNLVGVYSPGLFGSTAFKMAEYLAASQCVVAEPPPEELDAPLVPEANYLPYRTPEECVRACRRLLDDPDLARRMRHANHAYYLRHAEPGAHMGRLVTTALGLRSPDPVAVPAE